MSDPKGFSTFVGGMNNILAPEYLEDTQYARGTNGTNRGGHWQTRPRFAKIVDLPTGRFQGVYNYRDRQYVFVGGSAFSLRNGVLSSAISGINLAPLARRVYATETNDHLVVSDGCGNVVVLGDVSNRHLGTDELSANVGIVCYGQGRIFFTDRARRTLMAADIYIPGEPDSVLKVTEAAFLNETLSIMQPGYFGKITAMEFVRNSETGSGLSQLVCFSEGGVHAYNVYLPRASDPETGTKGWLDSQIGQTLFRHGGCAGNMSVFQQNNDLFFRPDTGITTLSTNAQAVTSSVRALPISIPISPLLKRDELWTLEYVSGTLHDNRVLYTHGLRVDTYGDFYFDSIVPVDLVSFYSSEGAVMTFDGVWTDKKFLQILSGQHQGRRTAFVVAKEADNTNVLYELSEENVVEQPRTRLITKRLFFDSAYRFAHIQYADLWFENIRTNLDVKLYFRGDDGIWHPAGEGTFQVPYYTDVVYDALPQSRNKIRINMSKVAALAGTTADKACMFQFCLEFTGVAEMPRMLFVPKEDRTGDVGETLICQAETSGIVLTSPTVIYDYDYLEEGALV